MEKKLMNYKEEFIVNELSSKGLGFGEDKHLYLRPGTFGIKNLGKVDFLTSHCGYNLFILGEGEEYGKTKTVKQKRKRKTETDNT